MSILTRIWAIVILCSAISLVPFLWATPWEISEKILLVVVVLSVNVGLSKYLFRDVNSGLSALETGLLNLKDGEFSTSLSYSNKDELGQMCELYNQTIDKLRAEKHWLYQRELLLDKITQSSPDVLFLVNDQEQVVFSNITARHFFSKNTGIEGMQLKQLLEESPSGVAVAIEQNTEGLFSLRKADKEPETWHMATGNFLLNNQGHKLFILKQMTRELSRQEVSVWKKVIRVISHELNNSLGPISSMLHSGKILSKKVEEERLNRVFDTIDERIKHLSEFVQGYGKFAKIPEPKIEAVSCEVLFSQLAEQWEFNYINHEVEFIDADPAQLEQLLINLLKNAHESESLPEKISIEIKQQQNDIVIMVTDQGKGIKESRLNSVLIPFYSTKAKGSGLGLALCREIIDAHHGNIALYNRDVGGLLVRLSLPML